MAEEKHTPLPWGVSHGFDILGLGRHAHYISGPGPESIGIKLETPWVENAWIGDDEAKANVEFIVRACNAHYDLIEALENILAVRRGDGGTKYHCDEIAQAALDKAKPKS